MAILYSYYGDDFTGSTDVLEQLGSNGVPGVLFLGVPTAAHVAAFPDVQAIGLAGDSRSRSPEWMSANLPTIFGRLKEFGAPVAHYKVCSTFDSSPMAGSIGRAMEIGREVFSPRFIPIVVGAPHLRRYVAFGNLFAADADGVVQRIDRHPMSRHPVTPMHEADLRVHLAAQGEAGVGLADLATLKCGDAVDRVASLIASGCAGILFDTVDAETQEAVGQVLWNEAQRAPMFSVGSSGLTAALIATWRQAGMLPPAPLPRALEASRPLLVVSGSCSVKTQRQIEHALAHGYSGVRLDPAAWMEPAGHARSVAFDTAGRALADGRDTVVYTALGPTDAPAHGEELGVGLGVLLRDLLRRAHSAGAPVGRVMIGGGDTSSHAVQQLGLHALTWVANLQPGGPLCRAHADSELDGMELVLKGGQVGSDDFFDVVRGDG
ncbi:MAG TPA: four-carbon acid sugar kinase family protein [Acidobacteriaceae bacterium]|jgi:uncharacterized protein YgbK (DUF1537 family)